MIDKKLNDKQFKTFEERKSEYSCNDYSCIID